MTHDVQPVHLVLQVDGKKHKIAGYDVRLTVEPGPTSPLASEGLSVSETFTLVAGVLTARATTSVGGRSTTTVTTTEAGEGSLQTTTTTADIESGAPAQ